MSLSADAKSETDQDGVAATVQSDVDPERAGRGHYLDLYRYYHNPLDPSASLSRGHGR